MRAAVVVILALCCAAARAQDRWPVLAAGGLSLQAPQGTTLLPSQVSGVRAWSIARPDGRLRIVRGPQVADGDDSEPRPCYVGDAIVVDGRAATLRVAKPHPRLD